MGVWLVLRLVLSFGGTGLKPKTKGNSEGPALNLFGENLRVCSCVSLHDLAVPCGLAMSTDLGNECMRCNADLLLPLDFA